MFVPEFRSAKAIFGSFSCQSMNKSRNTVFWESGMHCLGALLYQHNSCLGRVLFSTPYDSEDIDFTRQSIYNHTSALLVLCYQHCMSFQFSASQMNLYSQQQYEFTLSLSLHQWCLTVNFGHLALLYQIMHQFTTQLIHRLHNKIPS